MLTLFTCGSQPEKVKFQLRLGQSKPIYNAFKAIQESPDWQSLSDARKRIVEGEHLNFLYSMLGGEDICFFFFFYKWRGYMLFCHLLFFLVLILFGRTISLSHK